MYFGVVYAGSKEDDAFPVLPVWLGVRWRDADADADVDTGGGAGAIGDVECGNTHPSWTNGALRGNISTSTSSSTSSRRGSGSSKLTGGTPKKYVHTVTAVQEEEEGGHEPGAIWEEREKVKDTHGPFFVGEKILEDSDDDNGDLQKMAQGALKIGNGIVVCVPFR